MKKYRCGKCGYIFEGDLDVCPSCKTRLHYHFKEDAKKQEEIIEEERVFHFDDPEVQSTGYELDKKAEDALTKAVRENVDDGVISYFDGNPFQRAGWKILGLLVTLGTAFIGLPWAVCFVKRWEAKHTVINGFRLKFDGKGIQLFGRNILWLVLTLLTVGIFLFWYIISLKRWTVRHTFFDLDRLEN